MARPRSPDAMSAAERMRAYRLRKLATVSPGAVSIPVAVTLVTKTPVTKTPVTKTPVTETPVTETLVTETNWMVMPVARARECLLSEIRAVNNPPPRWEGFKHIFSGCYLHQLGGLGSVW